PSGERNSPPSLATYTAKGSPGSNTTACWPAGRLSPAGRAATSTHAQVPPPAPARDHVRPLAAGAMGERDPVEPTRGRGQRHPLPGRPAILGAVQPELPPGEQFSGGPARHRPGPAGQARLPAPPAVGGCPEPGGGRGQHPAGVPGVDQQVVEAGAEPPPGD